MLDQRPFSYSALELGESSVFCWMVDFYEFFCAEVGLFKMCLQHTDKSGLPYAYARASFITHERKRVHIDVHAFWAR